MDGRRGEYIIINKNNQQNKYFSIQMNMLWGFIRIITIYMLLLLLLFGIRFNVFIHTERIIVL